MPRNQSGLKTFVGLLGFVSLLAQAAGPLETFRKQGAGNGAVGLPFARFAQALSVAAKGATKVALDKAVDGWAEGAGFDAAAGLDGGTRLWIQKDYTLLPAFTKAVPKVPGASVESIDLIGEAEASVKSINDWSKTASRGAAPQMIAEEHVEEFVATGVYRAKLKLKASLEPAKTPFDFSPPTGKAVKTKRLHSYVEGALFETDDLRGAVLPMAAEGWDFVVLMPKEPKQLAKMEKSLSAESLTTWVQGATAASFDFEIPPFRLSATTDMKGALSALGAGAAFAKGADFSATTGTKEFFCSYARLRGSWELSAEGAVPVATAPEGEKVQYFGVDRGFVFAVRERASGAIGAVGRVTKP